jgi:hypothetical protein
MLPFLPTSSMDPKTRKNAPTLYPSSRRFLDIVVDVTWLNNHADEWEKN